MPLLNCPVAKLMLGADHRDTLKTRRNLAQWRGEAGDMASAVAEFEGLVGDPTRVLSADHPDTTKTAALHRKISGPRLKGATNAVA